jgi:hypothetical protein
MPAIRHQLGRIVATPAALHFLTSESIPADQLLQRHVRGDWGNVGESGIAANEEAIQSELGTVISVYRFPAGVIWVATSLGGDEIHTTLLLPGDW